MMVWWMEIFTQKNVHPPQSFNTQKTGVRAFHMSGKRLLESGMRYRNERVHMGLGSLSEFECYHTDEAEIRRAAEILRTLGEDGR